MQEKSTPYADSSAHGNGDECVLFIDISNIFIEAQKYRARQLKLRVRQDPRCRIDTGKLVDLAVHGRTMTYGKLYGSEPPAVDTMWKKIREKGLDVKVFKKDFKGKEKEVDTALTADAVRYALKSQAHKQTVIIIAGDRDYCPLVKTLLEEKTDWTVELLAFDRSISKQMRDIESASFKIIKFEDLLSEHTDSCCFEVARWRTELYRIPKNRTIILCFKEPLISTEANEARKMDVNQLLRKYAEAITLISGVPCCYHMCKRSPNTDRRVCIIGYTQVHVEHGDPGIDFFRICRENKHTLDTCAEICQLYETYKTAMETDDTAVDDEIQLQNRFLGLEMEECTEGEEEKKKKKTKKKNKNTNKNKKKKKLYSPLTMDNLLSHIYDDNDSGIALTESMSQETEGESEDSDTEGFTEVKLSSEARHPIRKYSSYCPYEFSCSNGRHCDYKHTQEQVDFFKANGGKGQKGYKSKPCCSFAKGICKHGAKGVAPNCAFYHSTEEARCYMCKKSDQGLAYIGHAENDDTCPSKTSAVVDDDIRDVEAMECLNQECTDSDDINSRAEAFANIKSSSNAGKRASRFSEFCLFEFGCKWGQSCKYAHTDEQVSFFKVNGGKGQMGYKSKPCWNFQKGSCKHGPNGVAPNCAYYHSTEEARCYVCKNSNLTLKYIGHASHDDTCPLKRVVSYTCTST